MTVIMYGKFVHIFTVYGKMSFLFKIWQDFYKSCFFYLDIKLIFLIIYAIIYKNKTFR